MEERRQRKRAAEEEADDQSDDIVEKTLCSVPPAQPPQVPVVQPSSAPSSSTQTPPSSDGVDLAPEGLPAQVPLLPLGPVSDTVCVHPQPLLSDDMQMTEQEDNPWRDFCAIEEQEAKQWVCDIATDQAEEQCEDPDACAESVELDPEKVAAARAEEVAYMEQRGLWQVVPIPLGVVPVSVRWVDVLKGDARPAAA